MVQPYHTQTRLERMRNNAGLNNKSNNINTVSNTKHRSNRRSKGSSRRPSDTKTNADAGLGIAAKPPSKSVFNFHGNSDDDDDTENREPGLEITLLNHDGHENDTDAVPGIVISSSGSSEEILMSSGDLTSDPSERSAKWTDDDADAKPTQTTDEDVNVPIAETLEKERVRVQSHSRSKSTSKAKHSTKDSTMNRRSTDANVNVDDEQAVDRVRVKSHRSRSKSKPRHSTSSRTMKSKDSLASKRSDASSAVDHSSRNRVPSRKSNNNSDKQSIIKVTKSTSSESSSSSSSRQKVKVKHSNSSDRQSIQSESRSRRNTDSNSREMNRNPDMMMNDSHRTSRARSRSHVRSSSQARRSRSAAPKQQSDHRAPGRSRSMSRAPQRSSSVNPTSRRHTTGMPSDRTSSTRTRASSLAPTSRDYSTGSRARGYSTGSVSRGHSVSRKSRPTTAALDRKEMAQSSTSALVRTAKKNPSNSSLGSLLNAKGTSHAPPIKLPQPLHTRVLLTTSVYHNRATGIWITTINMNQRGNKVTQKNAGKYLKAFSFRTEREARESAYANAPPKMLPFKENPNCEMCYAKFSMFRRPSHCRNCGICICNQCSMNWTKANMPETYNIKNENYVKVCKSCNTLSKQFKDALLTANYEHAQALYNTGNINLRCPFMKAKGGEAMLPIHCAVEGGSLILLKWLVDVHFCPIKRIRTGNKNKSQNTDEMIATSKGRTLLDIAMAGQKIDILKYLVQDKKVSISAVSSGGKDLQASLGALEAVLKAYPSLMGDDQSFEGSRGASPTPEDNDDMLYNDEDEKEAEEQVVVDEGPMQMQQVSLPKEPKASRTSKSSSRSHRRPNRDNGISQGLPTYCMPCSDDEESVGSSEENSIQQDYDSDEETVVTTVPDACIICYENTIDCVITPCGHQICCLLCSQNLKTCPVCNVDCKFIRIFKP